MSKLEKLPVGLDLKNDSRLVVENHINAFNDILDRIEKEVDGFVVETVLRAFESDGSFPNTFIVKKGRIYSLTIGVEESFEIFSTELCENLSKEQKLTAKNIVIDCLGEWNILTETPCPGDTFDETEADQEIFEESDSAPEERSTNPLDFEKKELDSLLDNLMDK